MQGLSYSPNRTAAVSALLPVSKNRVARALALGHMVPVASGMEGWAMMADHGSELFAQEAVPRRLGPRLAVWTRRAIELVLSWQEVARQRRALLALNEHMLKDIGITRADAEREASRRFWDPAQERWRDWP